MEFSTQIYLRYFEEHAKMLKYRLIHLKKIGYFAAEQLV